MPNLAEFLIVAGNTQSRTVYLSGMSSALLFSAAGAIAELWQWEDREPLTREEIDVIQAIIAGASKELMMPQLGWMFETVLSVLPDNVLLCDGSTYLREDYPELYAVLDAAYIIDADSFRVPDMRGRAALGSGIATSGTVYNVGDMGGEERHELTVSELAAHSHTDIGHSHVVGSHTTIPVVSPGELFASLVLPLVPSATGIASANIQNTGSNSPHNNMSPFTVMRIAIVAR